MKHPSKGKNEEKVPIRPLPAPAPRDENIANIKKYPHLEEPNFRQAFHKREARK